MKEIWKPVKGFEGLYEVSNKGRVKSLAKVIIRTNGVPISYKEKILNPSMDNCEYLHVRLSLGNKYKLFKVHRLVAAHFLPDYSEELTINHKNHDKFDNRVENLEMMTLYDNIQDEHRHRDYYYCIEKREHVKQPKRYIKKLGYEYNHYRFLQSIRKKCEYMNTGLSFVRL